MGTIDGRKEMELARYEKWKGKGMEKDVIMWEENDRRMNGDKTEWKKQVKIKKKCKQEEKERGWKFKAMRSRRKSCGRSTDRKKKDRSVREQKENTK